MKLQELTKKIQEVFSEEQSKVLQEFIYFMNDLVKVSDFNELKEIVKELAEAQKRTEQRLEELAEAQKRTEQRLEELAEAQKRTEQELKILASEHRITRQELGGLSHSFGYLLEDRAYKGLPEILYKQFGIKIKQNLKREIFPYKGNKKIEINIIGMGIQDQKEVWIIGEAKSQLKKKHVDSFIQKRFIYDDLFPGEKFYVMVTYMTDPEVKDYAEKNGIYVFYSYELPL